MTDEKPNVHLTQVDMAIMEAQMGQLDGILHQLMPVADAASSMMQHAGEAHTYLQQQIDALKLRADKDDNEDGQLDAQVESISSGVADLSGHLAQLQDLVGTAGIKLEALEARSHGDHSALLHRLDELDVEAAALQRSLADAQAQLVTISGKVNAAATKSSVDALTNTVNTKANASVVQALAERTAAAEQAITSLQTRVAALEAKTPWTGHFIYEIPVAVSVNGSHEVTVTWSTPAANTNYSAAAAVLVGAALIGSPSATATVKQGSKTTTGCVVTVKNSGSVSLAIGTRVSVVAVG